NSFHAGLKELGDDKRTTVLQTRERSELDGSSTACDVTAPQALARACSSTFSLFRFCFFALAFSLLLFRFRSYIDIDIAIDLKSDDEEKAMTKKSDDGIDPKSIATLPSSSHATQTGSSRARTPPP